MSSNEIRSEIRLSFDHRVIFSENIFSVSNPLLADVLSQTNESTVSVSLFIDGGVVQFNSSLLEKIQNYFDFYSKRIQLVSLPFVVPGGEPAKNDEKLFRELINVMHDAKLCRHSYVLAVGGGAVLDSVCFAASIVHRGIRQVRIPTTVLAQNDAGIGIKNGIDLFGKKNFLGTFYPPFAVINDCFLLLSLNDREWRNGMAEAVKVALIRDPEFFCWIEENADSLVCRDMNAMKILIRRCAELHLRHIELGGDPFERGSMRPLDFGHWAAHKLEHLSGFKIGHGHAVAVGIAIDVIYSCLKKHLSFNEAQRILSCLIRLGFDLGVAELQIAHPITGSLLLLEGLSEFREHIGGKLCITLLSGIGKPLEVDEVDTAIIVKAVHGLIKKQEKVHTSAECSSVLSVQ
jgi:3-dehydroquinate synthase